MFRLNFLPILALSATTTACQHASDPSSSPHTDVVESGLTRIVSADVTHLQTKELVAPEPDSAHLSDKKLFDFDLTYSRKIDELYDIYEPGGTGSTEEVEDTGDYELVPTLFSDRSDTLNTGETVTLEVDPGTASVEQVEWYLDGSEVLDNAQSVQQARWSEPGTYTVVAQLDLDDGTSLFIGQTFTVLELNLDIGFVRCDDGGVGAQLTLTGTHREGIYEIYGSNDLETWTLIAEVAGEDGETHWSNCDQSPRPDTHFYRGAVKDNPDGDVWSTALEEINGSDPFTYEDDLACLLVGNDGTWNSLRTSQEVCTEREGALSSGLIFSDAPGIGGTHFRIPTNGVELPAGWAHDADANELDIEHNPWVRDTNDCDNYAEDFERKMEEDGHDVTFTLLVEFDKATCSRVDSAHALNDFHDGEGRIGFWEPQINRIVDLDLDGDGFINLAQNGDAYARPTEVSPDGRCVAIDTYDHIDDAIAVYGPLD